MREDLWTADAIDRLRALWAEGHSASQIDRRMGMSKNAIVGKARRELFQRTPLARVHVFSRRLHMQRGSLQKPGDGGGHAGLRLVRLGARPRRPAGAGVA